MDVASNPRIQVQVRSGVETTLILSPTYSLEPPTYEFIEKHNQFIIHIDYVIEGSGALVNETGEETPLYESGLEDANLSSMASLIY